MFSNYKYIIPAFLITIFALFSFIKGEDQIAEHQSIFNNINFEGKTKTASAEQYEYFFNDLLDAYRLSKYTYEVNTDPRVKSLAEEVTIQTFQIANDLKKFSDTYDFELDIEVIYQEDQPSIAYTQLSMIDLNEVYVNWLKDHYTFMFDEYNILFKDTTQPKDLYQYMMLAKERLYRTYNKIAISYQEYSNARL